MDDDEAAYQATLEAAANLSAACVSVLPAPPVSVILHGSLAAGGFVPGRSDIDLLVVVDHTLTGAEIEALVSAVRATDVARATGTDLLVVDGAVTRRPTQDPAFLLQVSWHPGASSPLSVEVGEVDPDLVTEFSMARAFGRALYGSAADEAIGLVPQSWVVARGEYWLRRWAGLADDAENAAFMVLTACRMWHFAVTGVFCSKADAASWAFARDPSLVGITHALRQRTDDPAQPVAPAEVLSVLRAALAAHLA
jgi:predicted nucleotidyltransferase